LVELGLHFTEDPVKCLSGKMELFENAASGDGGQWGREENNIPKPSIHKPTSPSQMPLW
jgi:hypothetical protein